ncbi:MAG: lipid-A-disaccharide synthase [Phycisphaerae bacterium]|nr:lipid-A-disaccharide synthase [Phycisphaerae bacterium]
MAVPEFRADAKPSSRPAGKPRIFISAAEPSGDRHAAGLVREIHRLCPHAEVFGVAGPEMQAAGCFAIDDLTSKSAMLVGAVRLLGHAWRMLRQISRILAASPADLAVVVDSPALHLPMAKRLKASGCPVLYYIAPQLWAWAPWRIGRLRRRVDRVATILPFEEEYFRQRRVNACYVGHPLIEQLAGYRPESSLLDNLRGAGSPVIACLPGSRSHVIGEVLPGQIEVARAVGRHYPRAAFLFAAADGRAATLIQERLPIADLNCRIEVAHLPEVLSAADFALCASGTATLEAACHGVPMVVMYNGSKWGYRLVGRHLITTPYLSLVNILAGRRIVPEFMPYYDSTAPIAAEAIDILDNPDRRATMRAELKAVTASLGPFRAAERTARMAMAMINVAEVSSYNHSDAG